MVHNLIEQYGLIALTWALSGLAALLIKFVFDKIKNNVVRGMLMRLWDEVRSSVLEVGQVYVSELDGNGDGKLSPEEKATAKSLALQKLKSNLGKPGLAKLVRVLGVDELDDYLSGKIEAFLGGEKKAAKELPPKL